MPLITSADLFECTALAYRKWAEAYDNLKAVKAEKDDGSLDWKLFHAERLKNNGAAEASAKALLDRLMAAKEG